MRLFVFFIFILTNSYATTYVPIPLETQIKESDAVIIGKYSGHSYKKLTTGEVVTVVRFIVEESAGIKIKDKYNRKNFSVIVPGGKWHGIEYQVNGAPKFKPNENVAVLVSKKNIGYVIQGLGLGKYTIHIKDKKRYLKNNIFPDHNSLGDVPYEEFNQIIFTTLGESLKRTNSSNDKVVYKQNVLAKRSIASSDKTSSSSDEGFPVILVFTLLMILSGISYRLIRKH